METMEKQLTWEVEEKKIRYDNIIIPNKKALVRSDNKEVLSILSDDYQLFNNKNLIDLCIEIEKKANYRINQFIELQGGKKVLVFLENDQIQKINKVAVREFLVIGNSFDGSSSLFVGYNSHMIRCENQFTDSKRIFNSKHLKGKMDQKIDLKNLMAHFHQQKKETLNKFHRMRTVKITNNDISKLVRLIIGGKEMDRPSKAEMNLRASIKRELEFFGNTAWGLFNGITHYTSNVVNNGNNAFGNVSGKSGRINKIAMDFLISLN
jgi:hypothetical protein